MARKWHSPEEMDRILDEAVARFAAGGIRTTRERLRTALMEGLTENPGALLEHGWTPDIIVHSVKWDEIADDEGRERPA